MRLETLKNFVSKLGFIYDRTQFSYGYDIELMKTHIESIDLDGEKVEEYKIDGTVVMDMGKEKKERISFVSFVTQSNSRLEFQSTYSISGDDIYNDMLNGLKTEDTFRIINQNVESNFISRDSKFLVHTNTGRINKVYSVPGNYKFENGVNDIAYSLLSMNNDEVFNCVSSAYDGRSK